MRPVPALSHVSATGQGNRVGFARISPPLGLPREDGWGRKDMEGRGRGPGPTDWPQHRAWPGWAGEGHALLPHCCRWGLGSGQRDGSLSCAQGLQPGLPFPGM